MGINQQFSNVWELHAFAHSVGGQIFKNTSVKMLPFLEVSHLSSSAPFYAAIIKNIGLRYLSEEDGPLPSITYGHPSRDKPVFQIREVDPHRALRLSHISLSAPSAVAADEAFSCARRASPDASEKPLRHPADSRSAATTPKAHRSVTRAGDLKINVTDPDGNTMEIVYQPFESYPSHHGGTGTRYQQSADEESSRVLLWKYDTRGLEQRPGAASNPSYPGSNLPSCHRRSAEVEDNDRYASRWGHVTRTASYAPTLPTKHNSGGVSPSTVVSTILGTAAAGAVGGALYSISKAERSRSSRDDHEPPSFSRRCSHQEGHVEKYSGKVLEPRTRYVEVDRVVDKVRLPDEHLHTSGSASRAGPRPEYITRYSSYAGTSRSRDVDDGFGDGLEDVRGRHMTPRSRGSPRDRSEAEYGRPPVGISSDHHHLQSSRGAKHPPMVQRSYTYDTSTPERDGYASTKSHRSSSIIRGSPVEEAYTVRCAKSGTRMKTTTVKVGGSPLGRSGAYGSSRDGGLPRNASGSLSELVTPHEILLPPDTPGVQSTKWDNEVEDQEDADSIVPSDSISCVGTRRSGRAYYN